MAYAELNQVTSTLQRFSICVKDEKATPRVTPICGELVCPL